MGEQRNRGGLEDVHKILTLAGDTANAGWARQRNPRNEKVFPRGSPRLLKAGHRGAEKGVGSDIERRVGG